MSVLLSENWIDETQVSSDYLEYTVTTLKFGDKQTIRTEKSMIYNETSTLAIHFAIFKSFKTSEKYKEYGFIGFGYAELNYDGCIYEFDNNFELIVKKEAIEFLENNYMKLNHDNDSIIQFKQTIQEKFGLKIETYPSDNTIYFHFIDDEDNRNCKSKGNSNARTIDFGELAKLVFKQIGLISL